jgi:hypothetical protein
VSGLAAFQKQHRSLTHSAYFAVSLEVVTDYLGAARRHLASHGKFPVKDVHDEKVERAFEQTLAASGYGTPGDDIYHTLEYMRQRRNHIMHLEESPSIDFRNLCGTYGRRMNKYWSDNAAPVDFAAATVAPPSPEEAIVFLKLLRISVQSIDSVVAAGCQ